MAAAGSWVSALLLINDRSQPPILCVLTSLFKKKKEEEEKEKGLLSKTQGCESNESQTGSGFIPALSNKCSCR